MNSQLFSHLICAVRWRFDYTELPIMVQNQQAQQVSVVEPRPLIFQAPQVFHAIPPVFVGSVAAPQFANNDQNRIVIEHEDQPTHKVPPPVESVPSKKQGRGRRPKSDPSLPKPPKPPKKKPQFCDKCGLQGKKKEFMRCKVCERNTHPHCYDGTGKNIKPKKYLCRPCKQIEKQKKSRNKETIKLDKCLDKAVMRRYQAPGTISLQQIVRIQDQGQKWVLSKTSPLVEDSLLGNVSLIQLLKALSEPRDGKFQQFLQLINFLLTFKDELGLSDFGQTHFQHLLSRMYANLPHKLHACIVSIYLRDVLQKNKTQNVKFLNQNHFFGLMAFLKDQELIDYVLPMVWPQVLRHLSRLPSMLQAFKDRQYMELIGQLQARGVGWYKNLRLDERNHILGCLVQGLYQVDNFHDLLNRKSQYMQEISKQKNDSLQILKSNEAEILQLDKKLLLLEAQGRVEEIPAKIVIKKQDRVKEEKRKRELKEIGDQRQRLVVQNQQIEARNKEIVKQLPFITTKIHFIGFDRQHRQYFYWHGNEGLLVKSSEEWRVLPAAGLKCFLEALDPRGFREHNLSNGVNSYLVLANQPNLFQQQAQVVFDLNAADQSCEALCNGQLMEFGTQVRLVLATEDRFTAYLLTKKCRWGSRAQREDLRQKIRKCSSVAEFMPLLSQLHDCFLFVQGIREEASESDREDWVQDIDKQFELNRDKVKKIPIRFWGISSEKYKKYYKDYLLKCESLCGMYICTWLFTSIIAKYLSRKIEHEAALVQKVVKEPPRKSKVKIESSSESSSSSQEEVVPEIKVRRRELRRSTRTRHSTAKEGEDDSERHQETCYQCKEYGDVVCCDTCPKVFHPKCLGLKQIPEGEWSCYKCMQKMTLERTTRSRTKLVKLRQL